MACFRIILAFKSHIGVDAWACIIVFETSDYKHYIRQSLWDGCRHVAHCPSNWRAFSSYAIIQCNFPEMKITRTWYNFTKWRLWWKSIMSESQYGGNMIQRTQHDISWNSALSPHSWWTLSTSKRQNLSANHGEHQTTMNITKHLGVYTWYSFSLTSFFINLRSNLDITRHTFNVYSEYILRKTPTFPGVSILRILPFIVQLRSKVMTYLLETARFLILSYSFLVYACLAVYPQSTRVRDKSAHKLWDWAGVIPRAQKQSAAD